MSLNIYDKTMIKKQMSGEKMSLKLPAQSNIFN